MAAIDSLLAATAVQDNVDAKDKPRARTVSDLKDEDFFKLIITELQNQDPLKPLDNNRLLEQVQSLQSVTTNRDLSTKLAELTSQQSLSDASSLIGKNIKGVLGDQTIEGKVEKVTVKDGSVLLTVGTKQIPLSAVTEVA